MIFFEIVENGLKNFALNRTKGTKVYRKSVFIVIKLCGTIFT